MDTPSVRQAEDEVATGHWNAVVAAKRYIIVGVTVTQ